jgi:hypothetical protein
MELPPTVHHTGRQIVIVICGTAAASPPQLRRPANPVEQRLQYAE